MVYDEKLEKGHGILITPKLGSFEKYVKITIHLFKVIILQKVLLSINEFADDY
jgi:hypothetical protein